MAMKLEVGLDEVRVVGRRSEKPVVKVTARYFCEGVLHTKFHSFPTDWFSRHSECWRRLIVTRSLARMFINSVLCVFIDYIPRLSCGYLTGRSTPCAC
jgi:hypothetical protein